MASGNTLLEFFPNGAEFPASNYATLDTRNNHSCADFDTTTGETLYFTGIVPQNYSGGGLTIYLHWAASTATTGTIGWLIAIERIGAAQQDVDSDGFASDVTVTATTVPGTSGHVSITSGAFSSGAAMDSLAAGESFRLRVTRDVANDTAAGDAELYAVEVRET